MVKFIIQGRISIVISVSYVMTSDIQWESTKFLSCMVQMASLEEYSIRAFLDYIWYSDKLFLCGRRRRGRIVIDQNNL